MNDDNTSVLTRRARHINAADLPCWPQFDDTERTALSRALDQGQWWRVGGSEVDEFEREFGEYNGAPYCLAVTNGTAALELALRIHGIGAGDEVVVPAFTFISTSLAVQNVGAIPVPADVDAANYCLSPQTVREVLTERTRAIIPVHMAGHVADLAGLQRVADEHGLVLIQDAAHAQGAVRDNALIGAHPTVSCFSFQNGKLITAGEGGALTLPDARSYEQAYLMHTCGRPPGDLTYQHVTGGSNYRLTEFAAAVLRAQLTRLAEQTRIREQRAAQLDGLLAGLPGVARQSRDSQIGVNPHYMYLLTLDASYAEAGRNRLVEELKAAGIPACVNFPPVYRTASFWCGPAPSTAREELAERCRNSEVIGQRGLWLHHRLLLAQPETIERISWVIADLVAALPRSASVS